MNDFDLFYFLSALLLPCMLIASGIFLFKYRIKSKILRITTWNIFILCTLLSFSYSIGESYFRFVVDTTDSFAISKQAERWMKRHYQLNNRNIRDNVDYEDEKKKQFRISVLGDSFAQGYGVKNVDHRFSNILRIKNKNWEVHNLSRTGFNTKAEFDIITYLNHVGYKTDLLLLTYCLNDIDQYMPMSKTIYKRIQKFNNHLSYLEQNSYFINHLTFRLFTYTDPDFLSYCDFMKAGYFNEAWNKQKRMMENVIYFTRKKNIKLAVVTFPFLQEDFENYQFKEVHNKLSAFWNEHQIAHLDLIHALKEKLGKDLVVNSFDAHPNELAHQIAASEIEKFIKQSLRNQ